MNLAQHQRLCHFNQPLRFAQTLVIIDTLYSFEPNQLLLSIANNNKNSKLFETFKEQTKKRHPFSISALADISDAERSNEENDRVKDDNSSLSSSSDETSSTTDLEIALFKET